MSWGLDFNGYISRVSWKTLDAEIENSERVVEYSKEQLLSFISAEWAKNISEIEYRDKIEEIPILISDNIELIKEEERRLGLMYNAQGDREDREPDFKKRLKLIEKVNTFGTLLTICAFFLGVSVVATWFIGSIMLIFITILIGVCYVLAHKRVLVYYEVKNKFLKNAEYSWN